MYLFLAVLVILKTSFVCVDLFTQLNSRDTLTKRKMISNLLCLALVVRYEQMIPVAKSNRIVLIFIFMFSYLFEFVDFSFIVLNEENVHVNDMFG